MNARYAVGLGARRGVAADDHRRTRARRRAERTAIDLSRRDAVHARKQGADETGLHEAARGAWASNSSFCRSTRCAPARATAPTHSPRVQAMFGVGSVAEAAALVGAGPGSRLARAARRDAVAACALAQRARGENVMTVHFIGAGPGAADLLTLRGRDLIARCPVCLYAGSLVPAGVLAHCPTGRAHRRHGAAVARRHHRRNAERA